MTDLPNNLLYSKDHEWVRSEGGVVFFGITAHAAEALGELVYIELPKLDSVLAKGDACAVVESAKSASDVYIPVSGKVIEVNDKLNDEPNLVNNSPYQNGWLAKIRLSDEISGLMDSTSYASYLAGLDH